MYGLGAFCILLVPLAYIDWKNRDYKLESKLRQIETRMLQLQTEGKQVMKRYHPIELQIKTLIAQYKRRALASPIRMNRRLWLSRPRDRIDKAFRHNR